MATVHRKRGPIQALQADGFEVGTHTMRHPDLSTLSVAGARGEIAIATAALTGALLVGDSMRASLRQRALGRLGWVRFAMAPQDRFFSTNLLNNFVPGAAIPPEVAHTRRLLYRGCQRVNHPGDDIAGYDPAQDVDLYEDYLADEWQGEG